MFTIKLPQAAEASIRSSLKSPTDVRFRVSRFRRRLVLQRRELAYNHKLGRCHHIWRDVRPSDLNGQLSISWGL